MSFKMQRLVSDPGGVAPVNPTLVRYRKHGLANTADHIIAPESM